MTEYTKALFMLLFGTKRDMGRTLNNIRYAMRELNHTLEDAFVFEAEPKCALFEHNGTDSTAICRELYKVLKDKLEKIV